MKKILGYLILILIFGSLFVVGAVLTDITGMIFIYLSVFALYAIVYLAVYLISSK